MKVADRILASLSGALPEMDKQYVETLSADLADLFLNEQIQLFAAAKVLVNTFYGREGPYNGSKMEAIEYFMERLQVEVDNVG